MTCDLADESALLVEVHSVKIRLVASEDLIGLWDDPDLEGRKMSAGSSAVWTIEYTPQSYHLQ